NGGLLPSGSGGTSSNTSAGISTTPGAAAASNGSGIPIATSTSTSGGGSGPQVGTGTIDGCSPGADDSGCVGVAFEGESIPLDSYVMFDLSCSMSCSVERSGCCRNSNNPDPLEQWRIQPVREAMRAFLQDPLSAGIGVGLGFFGDHDLNQNRNRDVCAVESHSDATVQIQKLPDASGELIAELDAGEPQGGTPTHLAIDGACAHVGDWKQQQPGNKVVILLVTDGIPEHSCDANIR